MASIAEITELLEKQSEGIEAFKKRHFDEVAELREELREIEKKAGRPTFDSGDRSEKQIDPTQLKSLAGAARALISGNQQKADELFRDVKAMSAGSDPDGGYVTTPMTSSTMSRIMAETSPIYRLARKVTLTHGTAFEEPIDKDAAAANWVTELAARPETDTPELGMLSVPLHEIYAMPKASQTLLDQADIDVWGWLQEKVSEGFAVKEAIAFHTGIGVGQPRGILTYNTEATADSSRAWGVYEHVITGTDGGFNATSKADALVELTETLKPQYRNGAVFLMNRRTMAALRKLKEATSDRYLINPDLTTGASPTLLGYPVEVDDYMPDPATGSLSIAFGNIAKAYIVVERPGVKFLTDPYTDKPNVRLYAYRRVGAMGWNSEALKFLKFSAS